MAKRKGKAWDITPTHVVNATAVPDTPANNAEAVRRAEVFRDRREEITPRMMQDAADFHDREGYGSGDYLRDTGLSGMSDRMARKMIKDARELGWSG